MGLIQGSEDLNSCYYCCKKGTFHVWLFISHLFSSIKLFLSDLFPSPPPTMHMGYPDILCKILVLIIDR